MVIMAPNSGEGARRSTSPRPLLLPTQKAKVERSTRGGHRADGLVRVALVAASIHFVWQALTSAGALRPASHTKLVNAVRTGLRRTRLCRRL